MTKKVVLGLSGGVDSAVSAVLLKEQGYEVIGLFMKSWEQDDTEHFCPASADLADAAEVCKTLDIRLETVNFSKEYWSKVFSQFLSELALGRTPNPDVLCNKEIKFDLFLNHALKLGADVIATGHYAQIKMINQEPALFKAKDREKDQSYFLHAIKTEALKRSIFPLGTYLKSEVRAIAKKHLLINSDKKDSTGICFIGERKFKPFLKEYLLSTPGDLIDPQGQVLGRHDGLMFYTIGQRQGLEIGGRKSTQSEPWYVVDKIIAKNQVMVAQGKFHPMLYVQGIRSGPIHWLGPEPGPMPLTCFAKIRYRQTEQACMIAPESNQMHTVIFSENQRAATPGQYIVFYDGSRCLGGAVIEELIR